MPLALGGLRVRDACKKSQRDPTTPMKKI